MIKQYRLSGERRRVIVGLMHLYLTENPERPGQLLYRPGYSDAKLASMFRVSVRQLAELRKKHHGPLTRGVKP